MKNFVDCYLESAEKLFKRLYNREMSETLRGKLAAMVSEKINDPGIDTVVIHNNYEHTVKECTLLEVINYVYEDKYIMTGYGTLFYRQQDRENPLIIFIKALLSRRKGAKKEMFKHVNDLDKAEYNFFNIMQLLYKLLNNGEYGASGEKNYIFANRYIGPSTTYSGYIIITSCIMYLESLMENNVYFKSTSDFIRFTEECELYAEKSGDLKINDWLDNSEEITSEVLYKYIMENRMATGSNVDASVVMKLCVNASTEMKNRMYYANNLRRFLRQEKVLELLALCYDPEFLDPNNPPEAIKEPLEKLNKLIRAFVSHPFIKWDRLETVKVMKRRNVILVDSDSVHIYLGKFKKFMEGSFVFDEETTKSDLHKINVSNIATNFISHLLQDILDSVTSGLNVQPEYQPAINMKSEFLYKRMALTRNKKNYSAVTMMREGKILNPQKVEIKGLPIRKVSTNKYTREYFTKLLYDEFLFKEDINPKIILNKFLSFENQINDNVTTERSTKFLVPGKFTNVSVYKKPESNSTVKAVLLWNGLNPLDQILPYSKLNMLPIRELRGKEDIECIKDKFPEEYERLCEVFHSNPAYFEKSGAKAIALPKRIKVIPEVLVQLVNIEKIVVDNTKAAYPMMESIGFQMIPSSSNSKVLSTFIQL